MNFFSKIFLSLEGFSFMSTGFISSFEGGSTRGCLKVDYTFEYFSLDFTSPSSVSVASSFSIVMTFNEK